MTFAKKVKKGKYTYFEEWDKGKFIRHIGNAEKRAKWQKDQDKAKAILNPSKPVTPDMPSGQYDVIYADPPWRYDFDVDSRATENHYPTLLVKDICRLRDTKRIRIQDKFEENAILFLWATSPKLNEAFDVIRDWGFTYKTNMIWVKDKIGLGWYCRNQHEMLLIAEKGEMPLPEANVRPASVLNFPRTTHSTKPYEFYALIEKWYPSRKYLEVFGTPNNVRPKYWTVFGNGVYD